MFYMHHNKFLYFFLHHTRKFFGSFRTRLVICFLLCSIIPFIIIGTISYRTSYSIAQEKILGSVSLSDKQLVQQLNNRFDQMTNVTDSVNNYIYVLDQKSKNQDFMEYFSTIRSSILSLRSNFQLLHICVFLPEDFLVSNEGLTFCSIEDLSSYQIDQAELLNLGNTTKWLYRSNLEFPIMLQLHDKHINAILSCQSLTRDNKLVFAIFSAIKSEELSKLLSDSFIDTPIVSYVITPDRQIVAHTDLSRVGTLEDSDDFSCLIKNVDKAPITIQDNKYLVHSLNNGYYLITAVPVNYIVDNINTVISTIFTSLLSMIPVIIGITVFISLNLSKKLSRLTKVVRSTNIKSNSIISKEFDHQFKIDSEYGDEIDRLASAYQEMLQTIDHNLANILKLSIHEEKLKYQLLQAQINPHFLYNILESIQTSLILGNTDTANQMIRDLAKFYRMTLRKNNDLITIRDELEIAILYLELEKLCSSRSFTWNIFCEDGIENFMICKFTLQPFLENCLLHGTKGSDKILNIDIHLSYGEDTVLITIEDDGIGIPPAQLAALQTSLKEHVVDYQKNFGISNVNARIASHLYGSGKIDIESRLGEGTTVKIEFHQILNEEFINNLENDLDKE